MTRSAHDVFLHSRPWTDVLPPQLSVIHPPTIPPVIPPIIPQPHHTNTSIAPLSSGTLRQTATAFVSHRGQTEKGRSESKNNISHRRFLTESLGSGNFTRNGTGVPFSRSEAAATVRKGCPSSLGQGSGEMDSESEMRLCRSYAEKGLGVSPTGCPRSAARENGLNPHSTPDDQTSVNDRQPEHRNIVSNN